LPAGGLAGRPAGGLAGGPAGGPAGGLAGGPAGGLAGGPAGGPAGGLLLSRVPLAQTGVGEAGSLEPGVEPEVPGSPRV